MKRRLVCIGLVAACVAAAPAIAQPSESYTPGPFDRLTISGQARIELAQGDQDMVTVVGGDDAQRAVRMHVRRGELLVSTEGDWKFWSRAPVVIRVQMKDVRQLVISGLSDIVATRPIRTEDLRIVISGKGDVRLPQLTARQLRFEISGAGDAELGGAVDELVLRVAGAGRVNAERLRAREARVVVSGAGNSELWVTEELRIAVAGPGSVNYWGKPNVQQSVSGFGSVSARGEKP